MNCIIILFNNVYLYNYIYIYIYIYYTSKINKYIIIKYRY